MIMDPLAATFENVAQLVSKPALPQSNGADGHSAFAQIMREHNQRLYRLAFSLLGDECEAEDVLQESYVKAYQGLSSFASRSTIGAWLASIVRNEAIDHLRARRARQARFTLEADLPQADDESASILEDVLGSVPQLSPEVCAGRDEMREILERAIAALPAPFRAVFMLREVEGLSVLETAEYLQVPTATVKTRDHRARMLLREYLGGQFDAAAWRVFEFLGSRCDALVARVRARLPQ